MAELKDFHFVDIPLDDQLPQSHPGPRPRRRTCSPPRPDFALTASAALRHHPLKEIAESPGHLLLLKLWQREEDVRSRRVGLKETRVHEAKRAVFRLCCLFFGFHGLFLSILFTAYPPAAGPPGHGQCGDNWWIPPALSLATSAALVLAVQAGLCGYWRAQRELQGERTDSRALSRCVQELRMKGWSFDLDKEPQVTRRMKSSSVEVKWRPMRWCTRNLVTIVLLCFTATAFPACRFVICG